MVCALDDESMGLKTSSYINLETGLKPVLFVSNIVCQIQARDSPSSINIVFSLSRVLPYEKYQSATKIADCLVWRI